MLRTRDSQSSQNSAMKQMASAMSDQNSVNERSTQDCELLAPRGEIATRLGRRRQRTNRYNMIARRSTMRAR